jgi:hypothetical protein
MPGEPPKKSAKSQLLENSSSKFDPPYISRNKIWLRHIGADVLFPPILLRLEKEKPFKKFSILFLFVKTSLIN